MSTYCVTFRSSSPQPEGASQVAEEKPALPLPPGPLLLPLPRSPSQPAECFSSPPGCFGFSRNRLARRQFPLGRVNPGRGQKPGAAPGRTQGKTSAIAPTRGPGSSLLLPPYLGFSTWKAGPCLVAGSHVWPRGRCLLAGFPTSVPRFRALRY